MRAGTASADLAQRRCLSDELWNRASSRNVGGHWPTNVLQWRLPASHNVAEMPMEANAAQYQPAGGMLSVSVKYSSCACSMGVVAMGECSFSERVSLGRPLGNQAVQPTNVDDGLYSAAACAASEGGSSTLSMTWMMPLLVAMS